MDTLVTLGDGLGRRRRRRRRSLGKMPELVGFGRRRRRGKKSRKGRKICIRTAAGKKVCGTRWRKRRRR